MFSPLENERSEQWFQQLNAPLKRLPAAERTELHAEVRQHLEALAAANEELGSTPEEAWHLALSQFGDPGKFGKKMAWEWQQGKTGFRADITAILACFSLMALPASGDASLIDAWMSHHHNALPSGLLLALDTCSVSVGPIVVAAVMGRKYPYQALKSVFYERVLSRVVGWIGCAAWIALRPNVLHPMLGMLTHSLLWTPVWLSEALGVAYLASVTKRGWYRPSWADFKIALPKRRRQVG